MHNSSKPFRIKRTIFLIVMGFGWAAQTQAQRAVIDVRDEPISLTSGVLKNKTMEFQTEIVGIVEFPETPNIRVRIADYDLGKQSYMTLESLADGETQRLDETSIRDSYQWSAIFNGGAVEVALHIAPGEAGVFVEIDRIRVPDAPPREEDVIASICGSTDDRVGSSDARVGRMTSGGSGAYCTAWLISNGAVLTAGHCIPTAGDLVEFGVPASLGNGTPIAASVVNQYPINLATVNNENSGTGQDWMVLGLNANTTTQRTAHNVQGFFRMTKSIPANGTGVRVTGFGLDNSPGGGGGSVCVGGTNQNGGCVNNVNCPGGGVCTPAGCCDPDGTGALGCGFNCNAQSQTQQTNAGAIVGSNVNLITHSVDTMPANSGSPMIWEANGLTVGIHTAGGCTSTGGSNAATRFSRTVLETAVRNFAGPNPVYADASDYDLPSNGGVFEPFHNLSQAIGAVVNGGTISLVPGFFNGPGNRFTAGADGKSFTIVSPAGSSFIYE